MRRFSSHAICEERCDRSQVARGSDLAGSAAHLAASSWLRAHVSACAFRRATSWACKNCSLALARSSAFWRSSAANWASFARPLAKALAAVLNCGEMDVRVLIVIAMTACSATPYRVATTGQAILDRATELDSTGQAMVVAQDREGVIVRAAVRGDQPVTVGGARHLLRELVAGCRTGACTLSPDASIVLAEGIAHHLNTKAVGLVGVGLVTGGIIAWGLCDGARCDGSPALNRGTQVAGATSIAIVSGALLYLLVGCVIAHACTK